jgi:hypothetical protein
MVIGNAIGEVQVFHPRKNNDKEKEIYHWHPISVNSIDISEDENYLVSSGTEVIIKNKTR